MSQVPTHAGRAGEDCWRKTFRRSLCLFSGTRFYGRCSVNTVGSALFSGGFSPGPSFGALPQTPGYLPLKIGWAAILTRCLAVAAHSHHGVANSLFWGVFWCLRPAKGAPDALARHDCPVRAGEVLEDRGNVSDLQSSGGRISWRHGTGRDPDGRARNRGALSDGRALFTRQQCPNKAYLPPRDTAPE